MGDCRQSRTVVLAILMVFMFANAPLLGQGIDLSKYGAKLCGYTQAKGSLPSEKRIFYRCPPCGCSHDYGIHLEKGNCPSCQMPLIAYNEGLTAQIDYKIAPFFKDGVLGQFYPKLIYPLFAVGILFSSFILIYNFRRNWSNTFLSGLILVLSLYGFKNQLFGIRDGLTSDFQNLFIPISFILLIGPLIYFHVKSSILSYFQWKHRYWWHFSPALFAFIGYSFLLLQPEVVKQQYMSSPFEVSFSHFEQITALLGSMIYLLFSFRLFHNKKEKQEIENLKISKWVRRFLTGTSAFVFFWSLVIFLNFWLYDFSVATLTYNPLWVFMGIVLMWFGMELVLNPSFFLMPKLNPSKKENHTELAAELITYKAKLEGLMVDQKLYLDPTLNLQKLAQNIGINPRYLSKILNEGIGKNFYEFVNYYRIEKVKQFLKDQNNSNLTIEAIAHKAGFKSKSTFNTAFKKQTNMTPREFMKLKNQL